MDGVVATGAVAILSVGLAKMRCTKAEKISQPATKVLIFQRKQFFAGSQAAFRFHGFTILHSKRGLKAGIARQTKGGVIKSG